MHKKMMILILAVLALISSITPVLADENINASNDYLYDFAKGTINTLGVTFTSESIDSPITRGEFVTALVGISGMSNIDGREIPYTDVTSDSPFYKSIKTAYNLSWLSDAISFNPNEGISYVQALKIGVHAIGGEYQASFYGGYPAGYVYLANSLELNEDIVLSNDDALTMRDAYVLLYNIISSKTFVAGFGSNGDVTISFGGASILENHHDMYVYEGILSANKLTNLYDETEKNREKIKVGNEEFIDEKEILDYLGYCVKVLYRKDGNKKYAEFVSPFDNNTVTMKDIEFIKFESNVLYYGDVKEKENRITLDSNYIYILNGKTTLLTTTDISSILNDSTSVCTFIDNNNDKKYDVLFVYKYDYSLVGRTDLYNGYIYDTHSDDALVDLSHENIKYTVRSYEKGVYSPSSVEDIKSGMVIATAMSADKTYADIIICQDTVEAKNAEKNGNGAVVIDGIEYRLSDYYNSNYTYKISEQIEFLLGINGDIVAETGGKTKMKYAYIIDCGKSSGLNGEVLLKVFDQSDEILVFPVADKVKLDASPSSPDDIYTFSQNLTDDKERFVRYSLNNEEKINCIDTSVSKVNDIDSFGADNPDDNSLTLHFEGNFLPRGNMLFADKSGRSKFNWKNTGYIFVIPSEANKHDEENYRIALPSEIKSNSSNYNLDLLCFDADKSGSPMAMMVVGGYLQTSGNGGSLSAYGVVEKITDAVDNEGENAKRVYLCTNSGHKIFYLPQKTSSKYFIPAPGDVIGYGVKNGDTLTYLAKVFDFATYEVAAKYADEASENGIATGFVYSINGGYIHYFPAEMQTPSMPVVPDTIDNTQMRNSNYSASTIIHIDAVRSSDGTSVESISVNINPETKMKDVKTAGKNNASFVVNRLTYNSSSEIYSYNMSYK